MATIAERLQAIKRRIAIASEGRPIVLVAVSKAHPAHAIREAYAAGHTVFGESYLQEAAEKQDQLTDLPIEWHFVGPIQSNKTTPIAQRFNWVHGVDRLKIAQRLASARPPGAPPINICLQVNISGETTKSGVAEDELLDLAAAAARLDRIRLRGLMAIPEPGDAARVRAQFDATRRLWERVRAAGVPLDTLSMGMTDDFELAIGAGSTMVRIGTAIFGARVAH
jgi:PLP dependent protein